MMLADAAQRGARVDAVPPSPSTLHCARRPCHPSPIPMRPCGLPAALETPHRRCAHSTASWSHHLRSVCGADGAFRGRAAAACRPARTTGGRGRGACQACMPRPMCTVHARVLACASPTNCRKPPPPATLAPSVNTGWPVCRWPSGRRRNSNGCTPRACARIVLSCRPRAGLRRALSRWRSPICGTRRMHRPLSACIMCGSVWVENEAESACPLRSHELQCSM